MNRIKMFLKEIWKGRTAYLFILVPFVSLCVFFFFPFIRTFYVSFNTFDGTTMKWVGLQNYSELVTDKVFQTSFWNTIVFTVESLILGVGIALISALMINQIRSGKSFFRAALFMPVVTNMVAVSMLWKLIYQRSGLINGFVRLFGGEPISFLASPTNAMPAVVVTSAWQGFGYSLVMLLAALEAIPVEYYEAAMMDGANFFQRFWHITLPELRFTALFLSITGVSGAMMVFTQIYSMTAGGPANATRTLMYDLFQRFIHLDLGAANAVGVLLFLFLLGFSILNLRLTNRGE
jgi:multiple sugar transport system permease protein